MKVAYFCVLVTKNFSLGFFFVISTGMEGTCLKIVIKGKLLNVDLQLFWLKSCLWEKKFFLIRKSG